MAQTEMAHTETARPRSPFLLLANCVFSTFHGSRLICCEHVLKVLKKL